MSPRIAFQSSLPRAGSTLFSNIVGQNPAFHVTPTSGLLDLLYVARGQFSRGEEFKAQGREEMERAFIGFVVVVWRAMPVHSRISPGCWIKAGVGVCITPSLMRFIPTPKLSA